MKNLILCGLTLLGFGATFALADCQTLAFPNGSNICLGIHKTSSTAFEVRTSNTRQQNLSNLTCQISLPNGKIVKLPNCQGTFYYDGSQGKIEVEADADEGFSLLVANYDFSRGTFSTTTSNQDSNNSTQYYQNYQIELLNPSTSNPATYEPIDAVIKVRYNGSAYRYDDFNGSVDLSVEEYRNGRWQSASASDFSLEKTSVRFDSSDRGEIRLNRLLTFKNRGEFRLIAKINQTNASAYQTFYVNSNGSERNDRRDNDYHNTNVKLIASDRERVENGILQVQGAYKKDLSFTVELDSYYRGNIRFEVEEYLEGRWRTANINDYTLNETSFYFNGNMRSKTFYDLLRFNVPLSQNQIAKFRLIAILDNWKRAIQAMDLFTFHTWARVLEEAIITFGRSSAKTYEWVDIVLERQNPKYFPQDYKRKNQENIKIYKLNRYSREPASSSDYEIVSNVLRFYEDEGLIKRFNNYIRFKTPGEYSIATRFTPSSYGDTITIKNSSVWNEYSRDNSSTFSNYTNAEFKKLKAVYEIWPSIMQTLKKDYPKLRNHAQWNRESEDFYSNMKEAINGSRFAKFESRSSFYKAFGNWLSLTIRVRGF